MRAVGCADRVLSPPEQTVQSTAVPDLPEPVYAAGPNPADEVLKRSWLQSFVALILTGHRLQSRHGLRPP